mgnify:CR=1 FL=1
MPQKILVLLGSVRFWIITLTAILGVLQGQDPMLVGQLWLGTVAGVGTLDSIASKIGGK